VKNDAQEKAETQADPETTSDQSQATTPAVEQVGLVSIENVGETV